MSAPSDLRVGICAIAKDEGSYLEEWVAYHHLQGYGPIRVYAHECTDNTHNVLARLAKYGLCEWEAFVSPPRRKPQWMAYQHGMEVLRPRTDWLAFIDLDEFLVTPQHRSIQAFLAEYGHLGAIGVNWKMFGSAGRLTREPGFVIERFTRCAAPDARANRSIKMLARTDTIDIPRVHTAHFVPGTVYQTVLGEPIGEHVGMSERVSHDVIRVNHYFTRSLEEWERKATRGRGAKRSNSPIKHRTREDFDANDHNDEVDTEILRWVEPMQTLIAELREVDLDSVYGELDAEQRRARRLQTDVTRIGEELRFAASRSTSLQVALQAESRRCDALEQEAQALRELVERIADSTSWRVGTRAVRVARLATLRGSGGASALDVPARTLADPPRDDAN